MNNQISIKSILTTVASAIGALGVFLPWATGAAFGISVTVSGTDGGDGWVILALLAVSVILAIVNIKKDFARGFQIGISISSIIAAIIALIKIINTFGNAYITAGIGLYVIVIFGLASAVMPWMPINKR